MHILQILSEDFTVTDLIEFIDKVKELYSSFGVGAAIGLPLFETVVPILPLFLMLAFNILSYGVIMGYLFTLIGTGLGTVVIFLIMRYISNSRFVKGKKENMQVIKYLDWIESTHPILHIIVLSVPFSPCYLINYSMGLSNMKLSKFLAITFISRSIMLVACIPFGLTLITLYNSGEIGGVQVMWLLVFGVIVLAGIVFGQIMSKRIKNRNIQNQT